MKALRAFLVDETGVTAIDYGLIAAGIAIAIIASVKGVGIAFTMKVTAISNSLK